VYRATWLLIVRRPWLIPALLGMAWAFRRRDWWRRPPFLPLPSRQYIAWRMDTAYGDPEAVPPQREFERFVRWAAAQRRGH
jgi:hypothetical protein